MVARGGLADEPNPVAGAVAANFVEVVVEATVEAVVEAAAEAVVGEAVEAVVGAVLAAEQAVADRRAGDERERRVWAIQPSFQPLERR